MLGELDKVDGRWRLRFRRSLDHPQEKVWRAITEDEHLRAWFPADIIGERRTGAPLRFVFRDEHGNELPDLDGVDTSGEVVQWDPPSVFELTWGDESVRLELEPSADGGCTLTLVDTFDELGKAARDATGWHICLDDLRGHLDGSASRTSSEDRFRDVNQRYVDALGPDASTIGPPQGRFDD